MGPYQTQHEKCDRKDKGQGHIVKLTHNKREPLSRLNIFKCLQIQWKGVAFCFEERTYVLLLLIWQDLVPCE